MGMYIITVVLQKFKESKEVSDELQEIEKRITINAQKQSFFEECERLAKGN